MEEEKAAAYYAELTQKGAGAARFKQGLGFSAAADNDPPSRGSAFMSNFVKASSESESKLLEKQSQIQSIQNKLKKKESSSSIDRKSPSEDKIRVSDRDTRRHRDRDRRRDRSKSRSRSRERSRRRSYRSSSRERRRDRYRDRDRDGRERGRSRSLTPKGRKSERGRKRSRSRSKSYEEKRDRRKGRSRSRSHSLSPRRRKTEKGRKERVVKKEGSGVVDYAKLIHGYDNMTPAEKVKAKMKVQLSQTAEKDDKMGAGSQWERFDFDKDAPIEDEVLEAADDDAAVSKRIGQSFRFASLEGKREDAIRNAHDDAMFGVPVHALQPSQSSESGDESENEDRQTETNDTDANPASSLLNEKVLSKQQGSWRDRARRNVG